LIVNSLDFGFENSEPNEEFEKQEIANNLKSSKMNIMEQLIQNGIQKGKLEGKKLAIYEAFLKGHPLSLLSDVFGISVSEINKIVDEMKNDSRQTN
jgi:hypothetical protein